MSPKEVILDVAEELFAASGYHGVSVRDITEQAGLRLASVNYYYQSKENLFLQVLKRRGGLVVAERRTRLAAIDFVQLAPENAIRAICQATIAPLFERLIAGEAGWRAYVSLLANYSTQELKNANEPPALHDLDLVSVDLIHALQRYSIHADDHKAHLALQFITGTSLYMMTNNGRLNTLSENRYRSDAYAEIYQQTTEFIVAGVVRLLRH